MPYASCPTAIVNAPVEIVWALLADSAGWGDVFDVRVNNVDPPGPAVAGQKIVGETGPRLFHLKLVFRVIETDAERHRLVMDIKLPFGIAVREDLKCTPLDAGYCRVDYHCGFDFPKGWRGASTRLLMSREMNAGPVDSLSRLKHAAELRYTGQTMPTARRKEPVMIVPSPELPDDLPVASVELPPKVQQALTAAGLRTVGDVREAPDTKILRIQDLGESSLALLRKTLGLPSSLGVRCDAAPTQVRGDHRDG